MAKRKEGTKTGKVFDGVLVGRLLRYTKPYRGYFFLALLFTVSLSILAPVMPFLFQRLLDDPVAHGNIPGVQKMIIMIIGVLVLRTALQYGNTYLTNWLGQSVIRDIRNQVFRHILSLRLKFFDKTPVGTLQTRAISDVETLNNVFGQGIVQIMGELLQLVAIVIFMLSTSMRLTLAALVTLPIMIWATIIFKNKIKVAFQKVRTFVSKINAFLQEHITGMLVTQIFNREDQEFNKFDGLNKNLRNANLDSVRYYSVFFPVIEIISSIGLAVLVWYGTGSILKGYASFGLLVAFIMYIQMFFRPLRMLADRFNTLQLGMVSAERIFKILDTNEKIPESGSEIIEKTNDEPVHIYFNNVHFAYNEPEWVLQDVSFEVCNGETVAFVGSTGAGKTTIINLLTRLYDIQKGSITLNGTKLTDYTKDSLRNLIGLVLQDVFLFSGSIRDNITINNPDIPQEAIIEAAKIVGAHDFIMKLPGGYDYDVRERGSTLSAGQRQLIAFARVLVYDPKILILDEATSNIDTESEELIQQAIEKVMKGRTSIIIAHRLSTIQKADKIMVMDKGKVVESGNHQSLLAKDGLYKRLYTLQFS